jgi:TolA-binding protein
MMGRRLGFATMATTMWLAFGWGNDALAQTSKKKSTKAASTAGGESDLIAPKSPDVVAKESAKLPPGERQLKSSSLGASFDLSDNLRGNSEGDLLRDANNSRSAGGDAAVEQTVSAGTGKARKKALNLGEFRTQDIAQGYVAPPGVADFAAYFRSSVSAGAVYARPGGMSAEEFTRQEEAEKLRAQTNVSIRQILASKPSKEQRLDLLMRLSEIQIERHAYFQEHEIRVFNEAHDKWEKSGGKGAAPVFSAQMSQRQLNEGIDALRKVVNEYPTHARTPEALFTLGFLLTQIQSDSSALYFERLVKAFPKSNLVPDSWLALGEYHFSKSNFSQALDSYRKVLDFKAANPKAYHFAVYKLGWTYFNLRSGGDAEVRKNLEKSLAAFKLVVTLSAARKDDKILADLRRDSLRDMVLVFADLGDVAGAQKYFEGLGERELYLTMLERLGWQYSENGEFQRSIDVYSRLVSEAALHPKLPSFYAKIPELYEKLQQSDKVLAKLRQMAEGLSPASPWGKKFQGDKAVLEEKDRILSKELRAWPERYHADAQKRNVEKRFDDALSGYGIFLEYFGTQPESYNAHFFKAEILARRGRFLEASDSYMRAVEIDAKYDLKNKKTSDALVNAIACADKVLEKSPPPKLPDIGTAGQAIPVSAVHARLLKALDIFVQRYPTDNQVLEFSHRAAKIVYAFGDYPNARKRWMAMAARFPKSDEVRDGLRFSLKVHVHRKDWDNAIADSRTFLAFPGVKESKLAVDLVAVLKASIFSKALLLESKDKRSEAGDLFLGYQREFPADSEAPKAVFNAANNRFKQGRIDEAIAALQILLAQYPKSSLSSNAMYMIASANDSLGKFAESAASYEQFSRENPQDVVTPDVLLRAADERLATSEYELALKDVRTFQTNYPKHEGMVQGWTLLGKIQLKLNNLAEASKAFSAGAEVALAKNPRMALYLHGLAADASWRGGNKSRATQEAAAGVTIWSRLPENGRSGSALEGLRLVALVRFAALDEKLAPLYSRNISDGATIVEEFQKIQTEALSMEQKYTEIVKLGNAEAGVAALYRVAEIREFLSSVLLKAPVPADATADEVEKFRSEVEKIAMPMAEESIKLYAAAWQKGNETEAITPFQHKLHEKLAVLRPSDFRRPVGEMPVSSYYNSNLLFFPETSALVKK